MLELVLITVSRIQSHVRVAPILSRNIICAIFTIQPVINMMK